MTSPSLRKVCVIMVGAVSLLHADELTIREGARLQGKVQSIDENGVLSLVSPLAVEPLRLKRGIVEKVKFTPEKASMTGFPQLLELTNGDVLPVRIESADEREVVVNAASAGMLKVAREAVRSVKFSMIKPQRVYRGPQRLSEWTMGVGEKPFWEFEDRTLSTDGSAYAASVFKLPEQYALKFKLKWNATPNLQVYFSDPFKGASGKIDRYAMTFHGGGIEIQREMQDGSPPQPVILLVKDASEFEESEAVVELRVDRKSRRLQLWLDGELEATGVDLATTMPTGGGVAFECGDHLNEHHEVSEIEVWQTSEMAVHVEKDDGAVGLDRLTSQDEESWGGNLLLMKNGPEGLVCVFQGDGMSDLLEFPESTVAQVTFAKPAATEEHDAPCAYRLKLQGTGNLQVNSCEFSAETILVGHPLLGELKLRRRDVVLLELTKAEEDGDADKDANFEESQKATE